jgi:hypothetical protein
MSKCAENKDVVQIPLPSSLEKAIVFGFCIKEKIAATITLQIASPGTSATSPHLSNSLSNHLLFNFWCMLV